MLRTVLFSALTAAWPLAVWLLGQRLEPRWLAVGLVLVGALRLVTARERLWVGLGVGALVLAAVAALSNEAWPLRWYPVLVNGALLALFGATLLRPPSMVERLARLREPDLPPHAVAYTRQVTKAWCAFFVANGTVAAGTALFASDAGWALYNGGIAYALMGLMAGGEYLVRRRVQARHAHG